MALPHAKPGESVDLNPLGETLKEARTQTIGLTGAAINLRAGEGLYLNGGEPHFVKAEEDSSLLLTIILKT